MRIYVLTAVLGALVASAQSQILMDQIGPNNSNLGALLDSSQDFETANNAFDLSVLDDFTATGATTLTSVEAVLAGFSGFTSFGNVQRYRVEVYSSGAAAGSALTGNIGSQSVIASSVTVNTAFAPSILNSALVTIPINISLPSAGTFWLAVVPTMDFAFGQTGVVNSTFGAGFPNGTNMIQANPGGGFGLPGNQQTLQRNAAYRLTASAPVPEPMSMVAIAMGMGALALRKRKRA